MNKNLIGTTVGISLVIFILLWMINFFHISYPVSITTSNVSTELSVVGEGKVDIVPDTATVNLGITVDTKPTVGEVKTILDKTNNDIVAAVMKQGIKKEDIKTQNYSLTPSYQYIDNQNKQTGFQGSVNMSIKMHDTNLVGNVIESATAAGANQVLGTDFSVDNPDKAREEARNKAIENAKEQAQKLASNLGIRLGKVTNIVESGSNGGPVPMFANEMTAGGFGVAKTADLQPGSQTISSVVTLYFEKR